MAAKDTVTASMIYIGVLALVSQGWLKKVRSTVSKLSGSA